VTAGAPFINNGQYSQNAGTATMGNLDGSGTTTVANGAVLFASRIRQNTLTLNGSARVAQMPLNNDPSAVNFVNSISIGVGQQFDLNNNSLIVDYTGGSPRATLEFLVAQGRAGATWLGNGFASTTAGAGPSGKFAIGIGELSDTSFVGAYLGFPVDSTVVLLRYTLSADFNLDGTVNVNDFSRLAASFNTTGRWGTGDADYSGIVNIGDFALLASNFNQSASNPPGTAVPEPLSAGALATMLATFRSKRPKRRVAVVPYVSGQSPRRSPRRDLLLLKHDRTFPTVYRRRD
jgi:hypothetical protein